MFLIQVPLANYGFYSTEVNQKPLPPPPYLRFKAPPELKLPLMKVEDRSIVFKHEYIEKEKIMVKKQAENGEHLPKEGKIEDGFVVVHVGGKQFKVTVGDTIITHRLHGCDVADEIIFNKVLLLGTKAITVIGRPLIKQVQVKAQVEEHVRGEKVIAFKKKRRKGYKKHKGFRADITTLRIKEISFTDDLFKK